MNYTCGTWWWLWWCPGGGGGALVPWCDSATRDLIPNDTPNDRTADRLPDMGA